MSTIRLRRFGREYRNKRYKTINGTSLSNTNAKLAHAHLVVPVMQCQKMSVTDVSFRQGPAIEFLVKEGNSLGVIYK
jgi:hypothetical protein